MPPVVLTVGAVDRDWPMGDDVDFEIDTQTRMDDLFKIIAERKNIPKSRFVLKIPSFLVAPSEANPEPEPTDNECVPCCVASSPLPCSVILLDLLCA